MGLANIDLLLGLTPRYNLYHVLKGEKSLAETLVTGPGGMKVLPASSGIAEMTALSKGQKLPLLDAVNSLKSKPEFLLIDTAAGIRETSPISIPPPTRNHQSSLRRADRADGCLRPHEGALPGIRPEEVPSRRHMVNHTTEPARQMSGCGMRRTIS
jgi:septum formation inhibitor-activating ATPase MinD